MIALLTAFALGQAGAPTAVSAAAPASAPAAPSAEAEALGVRLARGGSVMALLPLVGAKESEELVAAHPELSPGEKQALREAGRRTLAAGMTRIENAFGRAYARRLSLDELRTLVAQVESPAQVRLRAIQPTAMAEALAAIGTLDFKGDTRAAFCRDTGKLCTP